ncbi:ADP-heptose synthase / D-glycero-beta-D-manno-heptose 7-phosphate kinase [Desulfurella amilsii]|uniref:D-glycero-beta-D-manno-heptose 1-phosphate adenylyltransferase n=1 Tax=Desulfurella amilsii TaxID=1562698 RepID=A0A1X4XZL7_9BACT|nr:D-glycero-beta-D-manno-heptose 1-phosphate adenylyltransferase [Desulfurella amilsii]OSS42991.1 ADP-heptose synthase / D-glycero-beta-D-manno-heptose 7-phosphate kinase [Desulfurella amilsii]
MDKIKVFSQIKEIADSLKAQNKKIVFTNGCFDIIHAGHVDYLKKARQLGDALIVGLNSDNSVKSIKGEKRPINNQNDRASVLSAFYFVDYIVIFEQNTPYELIELIKPDILVKGSDWQNKSIVGADIVKKAGGKVALIDYLKGKSTTNIIKKILKTHGCIE